MSRSQLIFMFGMLVALHTLALSAPALASGAAIGPFCIDGVTAKEHPEHASVTADGVWTPAEFKLDSAQAGRALAVVFDTPISASPRLESCSQIQKRMLAAGGHTILSGRVLSVRLLAQVYRGSGGNRLQIDPDGMDLVLGKVVSGSRPVLGGSMDLRGSRLWIGVANQLLALPSSMRGVLDIEAYRRSITGAHLQFGGAAFVTDLRPDPAVNARIHLNLADGQAKLWGGDFQGAGNAPVAARLVLDNVAMNDASLRPRTISMHASGGTIDVNLVDVQGIASDLTIQGQLLTWYFPLPAIKIAKLSGSAVADVGPAVISHGLFELMDVTSTKANLAAPDGSKLIQGQASARFARLNKDGRSVRSDWKRPSVPALAFLMPTGLNGFTWNEDGKNDALTVSGSLRAPSIQLGGVNLSQPFTAVLKPTSLAGELVIPVNIDAPAASGEFNFLNADQQIGLKGKLKKLTIQGRLAIPSANLAATRFEADAGQVHFIGGGAISVSSVVVGAKANFANADLDVSNLTALRLSQSGSTGTVLASTQVLILAQPVMKIGDGGSASQATVDLSADGGAKLAYDLAQRKFALAQVKLVAHDINFRLLGSGSQAADFGGTVVTNPQIALKQLEIDVDQLATIKVEHASLQTLSINADKIVKEPVAGSPGFSYTGVPTRALSLGRADATQVSLSDEIALSTFEIKDLSLGLKDAGVNFGKGMALSSAKLDASVKGVTEEMVLGVRHRHLDAVLLDAAGDLAIQTPDFTVNGNVGTKVHFLLGGPDEALNGTGAIDIGLFTAHARSVLPIKFDCRDTHELDVEMETNVGITGAHVVALMHQGKISGDASLGVLAGAIHSTGATKCDSPVVNHVIVPQGKYWTDGVCNSGLTLYHCRWESPEVGYSYHFSLNVPWITATAVLAKADLHLQENGNVQICNTGPMAINGVLAAGGYSAGFDSNYPGLDSIVNTLIKGALVPYQSLLLTTVGTGAGWLISTIPSSTGATVCITHHA